MTYNPSSVLAGERIFRDVPLEIARDEVLRFQGYKRGGPVPSDVVLALYDEAMAEGRRLMAPRAVIRRVGVQETEAHALWLEGGLVLHIPNIRKFWGRVTAVDVAICTIGEALEERVRVLFDQREFPLAVMLDSVGSAAVECLAEWLNDSLCQEALPDLKVTNRVSPGYSGWDVREQEVLFRLVSGDAVGVALNDYCVMTPGKSITFCAGAGPEARVDHYFVQCRRCPMTDCAYRRAPTGPRPT